MLKQIDHLISFVGSVLSIGTFIIALRFRSKVMSLRQSEDFHRNREDIVAQLKGFQDSISKDKLTDDQFRQQIHYFLINLGHRFGNLGFCTHHVINQLIKTTNTPSPNWDKIYKGLAKLTYRLEREI